MSKGNKDIKQVPLVLFFFLDIALRYTGRRLFIFPYIAYISYMISK